MRKRYLKNIEDIEALRNTDTKIYRDNGRGYFKFVNGLPCLFCDTSDVFYNATIDFNEVESKLYIEVEDEPSKDCIGKLGLFWDYGETDDGFTDVLEGINDDDASAKYTPKYNCCSYRHFRPLTPEEVEKNTGYKVVKED